MLLLEFLCGFIKFYLWSLSWSDLFLQFLLFAANLDGEFLDLQIELSNLRVIFFAIFLKSNMILFFLLSSNSPLLKLFLIPVQFQFNLFHLFVNPEDADLNIIQSFLMLHDHFVEFLYLIFQSSALALSHLPKVILSLSFLVLRINKRLCVEKFLVNVFQMFL